MYVIQCPHNLLNREIIWLNLGSEFHNKFFEYVSVSYQ